MSTKEERERVELLQGTLDLLILRTLLLGPAHGHAIAKAIEFSRDRCIPRCTGLSSGDGFRWKRALPRTTGGPNFTG